MKTVDGDWRDKDTSATDETSTANEFFSMDENGHRTDAALHEMMIEGVDDSFEILQLRKEALDRGVDPKTVDSMFPRANQLGRNVEQP